MTPERWREITATFHGALARDERSRAGFLDKTCAGDRTLRAEVDALLAAHRDAGTFGDHPVQLPSDPQDPLAHEVSTETTVGPRATPATAEGTLYRVAVWCAAAITAATFSYAGWLLIRNGGASPSFGWTETNRQGAWFVASVPVSGPAAGRLQPGDRLIEMNGVPPIGNAGTSLHRRSSTIGQTYSVTVERAGQRHTYPLTVAIGPDVLPQRLTYFAVSLVWCLVGLFIGFARPDKTLARLACAAAFTVGMVFLQVGVIRSGPIWQPLHVVLGFHFLARFPDGRPTRGLWRVALVVAYVSGAIVAAVRMSIHATLLAFGLATVSDAVAQVPLLIRLEGVAALFYPIAVIGMVLAPAWNYRRLTDHDMRRRVRWVAYTSGVVLIPQLWWTAVHFYEQTVGPTGVSRFDLFVNALTVAIPISVAYAVVAHRMFDIRVVVRRGLQYLLAKRALQAAVAVPIAALVYAVVENRHRTLAEIAASNRGYVYWIAAAGLSLQFRRPIRGWLDRKFFRLEYDREHVLMGLLDDVVGAGSIGELSRLVHQKLALALHPKTLLIWYRDPHDSAVASSSDPLLTPPDFPGSGRWLAWLEERAAAATFPLPPEAGLSRHDAHWLAKRGAALVVPITDSTDRLVGVLVLAEKQSEEPYTASDRKLLEGITKQLAVVRENLRLKAQVSEDQRIKHEVLARLDLRGADLLRECPACGACFDGDAERCTHDDRPLRLSLPVTRTIDGKYRLDRLIGKGGMGAVYDASDLRLDRSVAVKVMIGRAFGEARSLRRFRREARAMAHLSHPNIVGIHDFGLLPGEGAFLVLERVHGPTLRAELKRQRALPPADAAEWFRQLLDGLAAAHAQGVVHRDLKPENVVGASDRDGRLTVKILDFGLAKLGTADPDAGSVTAEGAVMGTLGYMSPEQLLGHDVDHRSDLFAVGVMLAEAITGERPFHGDDYTKLSRAVLHDSYQLPGSSAAARALDACLQRCLAKDPHDRIAAAAELRDEMVPLLRACPAFIHA
jgi:GAF domain-containing protein